ncbi:MAG: hypothetical protein QM723_18275 [Myxococcaceae bacterium]
MAPHASALWVVLAASAPGPEMTSAVEQLPLTAAPSKVNVDPFLARIELTGARLKGASTLCPKAKATGTVQTLECTRRIWAQVNGNTLELREFRGVPPLAAADAAPNHGWPLFELGLSGDCKQPMGVLEVGECAFTRGDAAAAKDAFTKALAGRESRYAHLRLGDFAAREGDLAAAFSHYQQASGGGLVGRMADERACAISGLCVVRKDEAVANTTGLPGVLRRELTLRTALRAHFGGRDAEAMELLLAESTQARPACEDALPLCQKLTQAALLGNDEMARGLAMRAFLESGFRDGPHEVELARAVAVASEKVGAPSFGAGILSSVVEKLPAAEVDGQLREIVRLYAAAHDTVRAQVVLEYADSRAGGRAKGDAWLSLRAVLRTSGHSPVAQLDLRPKLSDQVELANELARSALVRSAAQQRTSKEAP